jgi:hypothetical protein
VPSQGTLLLVPAAQEQHHPFLPVGDWLDCQLGECVGNVHCEQGNQLIRLVVERYFDAAALCVGEVRSIVPHVVSAASTLRTEKPRCV